MSFNQILPVILCGGSGTRLWPLSRESFPKQFLNLTSNSKRTLLQETLERLRLFGKLLNPILICNEEHRFILAEQIRELGVVPNSIILEPFSRNTAAPVALAALQSLTNVDKNEDPILLVLSSDHIIGNNENFLKSLKSALALARKGRLVTFGCVPHSAETGFGYIQAEKELDMNSMEGSEIKKFIEKPNKILAEKLILDKRFLWNSGMFAFKANTIIREFEKYSPELLINCRAAIKNNLKDYDFQRLNQNAFAKCQSISIDVAVMEKTKIGSVVPLDANWSDIGSWKALWEHEEKDEDNNVLQGNIFIKDVQNSFLKSDDKLLVGIGLKNIVAIDTNDALLISDLDSSQNIKEIVNAMKNQQINEATQHKKGFRPWGNYLSIAAGSKWQVKLINVNPRESLSLQKHNHRAEHWIVVQGNALVKIEEKISLLKENQSTFIPLGCKHKLSNPGDNILTIIEVQSGNYLGEDDIIRFEDKYGRVS